MRRKKKPSKSPGTKAPLSVVEAPLAPEAAPVSTPLVHLQARLASVRRSYRRATLETGACAVLTALAGWLTLECSLDYLMMLRWGIRLCFLVLALVAAGCLAWWLAVRPLRSSLHDDAIALMIERALPVFRTRFIATIQLLRSETAAKAIVRALAAETSALASTQRFNTVVDRRKLRAWTRAFGITLLIALPLAFFGAEKTAPLLRRAVLSTEPVPRRTKIDVLPTPRVLAVGDDFRIEARVGGEIPTRGRILIEPARGPKHELPFEPLGADPTPFSRVLRSVQEPFSFTVALGDARTEPVRIKVKPRPAVVTIDAQQVYPAYTGLKPERRSLTALKLLAGSRLSIRAKANTKLGSASIRLLAPSQDDGAKQSVVAEAPLKLEGWGRTDASGEIAIPAANITGLAIRLVDDDGVESRSNTVYRVERILDAPPVLKLVLPPRREEFITAGATMLIAFDARDDFGIARARLHYAVDWQEGAPHKTIELDVPAAHPRELLRRFQWQIPKLQPAPVEGQVIDYWLEISDANDVTGPGVTVLEHHQASIVTELEKRAELASRLSDAMEGLNTTRDAQERLNETLGEFIFEKPPGPP